MGLATHKSNLRNFSTVIHIVPIPKQRTRLDVCSATVKPITLCIMFAVLHARCKRMAYTVTMIIQPLHMCMSQQLSLSHHHNMFDVWYSRLHVPGNLLHQFYTLPHQHNVPDLSRCSILLTHAHHHPSANRKTKVHILRHTQPELSWNVQAHQIYYQFICVNVGNKDVWMPALLVGLLHDKSLTTYKNSFKAFVYSVAYS